MDALSDARGELAAAGARLHRLRRALDQPAEGPKRAQRWRVVRRMVEALRETLAGWIEAAPLLGDADPDALRRRAEVEATLARALQSLEGVEQRRRRLDEEQSAALGQLKAVAGAWSKLYRELPTAAPALHEGNLAALLGRFQSLLVESERALDEERQARRDADAADSAWRWIVDVSYPVFEERMRSCDATLLLPTLRRLIEDLDARWRAERAAGSALAAPPATAPARGPDEAAPQADAERDQRDRALDRAAKLWSGQVDTLMNALEQRRLELEKERARADGAAQERRAEVALLEGRLSAEKARSAELEGALRFMSEHMAGLREEWLAGVSEREAAAAALEAAHEAARQVVVDAAASAASEVAAAAAKAAAEAATKAVAEAGKTAADAIVQAVKTLPAPAPAPVETVDRGVPPASPPEAPADDAAAPTSEPVLDPGWARVAAGLGAPLGAAAAQLRRLYAARMPEDYRAVVRATAGYVAQASDVVRVLREYLDEAPAVAAAGRLDQAAETALLEWEPVLTRRGIRVSRSISRDLPPVRLKTETLRLALHQLLRNAWEAMPRGGSLSLRVWRDEATGEARAALADSGAGFSPAARQAPFAPFVSTKAGHLGIGLALCQRLARRGGGDLELDATAKTGAALVLRLPPHGENAPAM